MFDFQHWIQIFQDHYEQYGVPYSDAPIYGENDVRNVVVERNDNLKWKVLGVHHLTSEENRGNHNIYVEMLCEQNEREGFRSIHWTWEGRQPSQNAPDIFAGQKPLTELVDLPLNLGMIVSVWPHLGEKVIGLSSNHPDERPGNTIGHHSFFVCFQEFDETTTPDPDPIPTPDPIPDPPMPDEKPIMLIDKSWLNNQKVDDDDYIRIYQKDVSND